MEPLYKVKSGDKTYWLRGDGWNRTRFDLLKKEGKELAKVAVLDEEQNVVVVKFKDLEWDDWR